MEINIRSLEVCFENITKIDTTTYQSFKQEHGIHSQHTDSSNSGFLNSAKEWASELLSGQTKGGKVQYDNNIPCSYSHIHTIV